MQYNLCFSKTASKNLLKISANKRKVTLEKLEQLKLDLYKTNNIEYQGKPAFVVIPFYEYQDFINLKKNHITDEELYIEGIAKNEEYFEYRRLSQEQLAIKIEN